MSPSHQALLQDSVSKVDSVDSTQKAVDLMVHSKSVLLGTRMGLSALKEALCQLDLCQLDATCSRVRGENMIGKMSPKDRAVDQPESIFFINV